MPEQADRRYTLEEAQSEIAKRACAREGHDFEIIMTDQSNDPQIIICSRCGKQWPVSRGG